MANYNSEVFTVKVSNLPLTTTETALHLMFSQYGIISDSFLMRNPKTNQSRGYGYVKFYRKSAAVEAAYKLHGTILEGKIIRVRITDRRLRKSLSERARYGTSPSSYRFKYTTLKIDNLPYTVDERDIQNKFKYCGQIADIYVPRIHYTNLNKGFAFVRFYRKRDARFAMRYLNNTRLCGRRIKIYIARYGIPPPKRRFAYDYST